jgi:phosphoribosylformylglycinamidine synthase
MPDLAAEKALGEVLIEAARRGLVSSAHDLSDGGLAQGLVESALRHDLGVSLTLPEGDPTMWLFSETPARALVSLSGEQYGAFAELCAEKGVPLTRLGEVTGEGVLEVHGQFALPLTAIRERWTATIPAVLGA